MKTEKEYFQTSRDVFTTTDGKKFTDKSLAQLHQDKLDGKKKECPSCKGKGEVNGRYEKEWHNTSWIPTQGEYVQVYKTDKCWTCGGKGYLEQKWV